MGNAAPERRQGRLLAAAGVILGLLLPACSRRTAPVESGIAGQVLHFGNSSEPADLDPHTVTGVPEHNVMSAILEGLVAEDPADLHPMPGVAARWEVSADGLVYTFHLRPDARWSNGDPVTAGDFLFSFRRMLSPRLGSPYAYMLFCLKRAEAYHGGEIRDFGAVGVEAVSERTLRLTLAHPTPYFLALLNHFSWLPVHPPTVTAAGPPDERNPGWTRSRPYVGNGPFVLKTWEPGKKIVVEKNPHYWDRDRVRLNAIVFHPIGDHNIEERAFRAGQLHVTGTIPIDRIAHYQRRRPDVLRLDPYLGTYYYVFNVTRPPLDDVRVRRALALAVNRQRLVEHVTKAGEQPAHCFTPPGTAGYTADAALKRDADEARRLLAESGFPGGRGFPKLELLYNTSDAHARIAQAIQEMWRQELGVDIGLMNMEWKVYLAKTQEKDYDIARAGWIADYVDPNSFLDMWLTGGGNNRAGWANAEYDRLVREAARTLDRDRRHGLFRQAEAILLSEAPIMPLYFYRSKTLLHPAVRNWHPTLLDHHPWKHVYLER